MRARVKEFFVVLICRISKHETLVACAHVFLCLVLMDCSCDGCVLRLDIGNHIAGEAIETLRFRVETDLLADITSHLLKVHLLSSDSCLT